MQFRHQDRGIIISIPIGLAVSMWYLIALNATGFSSIMFGSMMISPILAAIIGIAFIVSSIVSGSSYIGRVLDNIDTPIKQMSHEAKATIIGVGLGAVFGIVLICTGVCLPFLAVIPVIPQLMLLVGAIGIVGGLCARVGRVIDRKVAKAASEESVEVKEKPTVAKVSSEQFKHIDDKKAYSHRTRENEHQAKERPTLSSRNLVTLSEKGGKSKIDGGQNGVKSNIAIFSY